MIQKVRQVDKDQTVGRHPDLYCIFNRNGAAFQRTCDPPVVNAGHAGDHDRPLAAKLGLDH